MNLRAMTRAAMTKGAVTAAAVAVVAVLGSPGAGTAAAAPSAARAGQWVGVDARHDVAAYSCQPQCRWKDAPGNASADMVRQVVSYRHDTIRITVSLRKVDLSSAFALTSILKKTEREGRYYGVIAAFSPGRTPKVTIRNPHGTPVECGAATPRVVGDKIKVVVPSRCLHSPDWIRWSGYTRVIFQGDLDNDRTYEGYFDKFRSRSDTPLNKNTLEFSRRIYRAA